MRDHIVLIEGLFCKEEPTTQRFIPVREPERYAITESADEFRASWDDDLSRAELSRLFESIRSGPNFEAYYLNRMVFLTKRQALVALNSLARDAD